MNDITVAEKVREHVRTINYLIETKEERANMPNMKNRLFNIKQSLAPIEPPPWGV